MEIADSNLGDLYKLDPSLFMQVSKDKKKLTRAEKRQEFTRVKEATKQRPETIDKDKLAALQREDPTLKDARRQADDGKGLYCWKDGLLIRHKEDPDSDVHSLNPLFVLPQVCREEILKMTHSTPIAGHFGRKRTLSRLNTCPDSTGQESGRTSPRCANLVQNARKQTQ